MGMAVHLIAFLILVSNALVLLQFARIAAMELSRELNFATILEELVATPGAFQIRAISVLVLLRFANLGQLVTMEL